jgi:2'-5' RNA ligase
MRVFIGIETGSALRELWGAANYMARLSGGHPTKKNNIHLTVRFLGDQRDTGRIARAMDDTCAGKREFYLELDELVFMSRLKIAWCSVKGDLAALHALRDSLENALAGEGYEREKRPFLPHITLVRQADQKWDIRDVKLEKTVFKVGRLVLYQSVRQNGELFYIPLHTSDFGAGHGG